MPYTFSSLPGLHTSTTSSPNLIPLLLRQTQDCYSIQLGQLAKRYSSQMLSAVTVEKVNGVIDILQRNVQESRMISNVLNNQVLNKYKVPSLLPLLLKLLIIYAQVWPSMSCCEACTSECHKSAQDFTSTTEGYHPMQSQLPQVLPAGFKPVPQ